MPLAIRAATTTDAAAVAEIYRDAVLNGTATFELEPPDVTETTRRMTALLDGGYPYLVAEDGAGLAGYAYAGAYRTRPAYRFTLEDSVYIAPHRRGSGVGRALLTALVEASTASGFRQMVAVIGDEASAGSIALHRACGFEHAGIFRAVGWKHGAWRATVLMQRALGDGDGEPPATR